ncbi:hypothetical protein [Marinobacter sp.]|uniref:hypothetical protein n=1 Tax=Marinobacter sp. TaxID=50741 RepID=UPI001999584C|nr:hypothetical protein [Marinobacter sp.]MBC7191533.1 hypothetical protein [Marinobacter sp.]
MKIIVTLLLALVFTGCTSTQSISFSPNVNYAVSIEKKHIDAVRSDTNDVTIFQNETAVGFLRIEPVPDDASSASEFLDTLRSITDKNGVKTESMQLPTGFSGFAARNPGHPTGYVTHDENADSILVISFPDALFDKIAGTVSPGI